ncbi:MAG: ABC transporter permease subunit [Oscillospiraceae bacterium]
MTYWLGVIVVTAIYMIAIIGVSILSGFTGLFSLGHVAFMAIGAYTSAIVVNTFQVPIVVGLAAGTLLATLIGLLSVLRPCVSKETILLSQLWGSERRLTFLRNILFQLRVGRMGIWIFALFAVLNLSTM